MRNVLAATRRSFFAAVVCALASLLVANAAGASIRAVVLQQTAGVKRITVAVSATGTRTQIRSSGAAMDPRTLVTVFQYAAHDELFLIPSSRHFAVMGPERLRGQAHRELAAGHKAAETGYPVPNASHLLSLARGGPSIRIAGLLARPYVLTAAGARAERIWVAISGLPVVPGAASRLLRQLAPMGDPLAPTAGKFVLRIEVWRNGAWMRVLDTTSATFARVPASSYLAPRHWHRESFSQLLPTARPPKSKPKATAASVDAQVTNDALGPVADYPRVYAVYWGQEFATHPAFIQRMNAALGEIAGKSEYFCPAAPHGYEYRVLYCAGLPDYGVRRGSFIGYEIRGGNPPARVGSAGGSGDLAAVPYGSAGPQCWDRFRADSPMYAIFVPEGLVDDAGWTGYHSITPDPCVAYSAGLGVIGAHSWMPWFVVKVPEDAMNVVAPALTPSFNPLQIYPSGFDAATKRASHEFVEAATDVIPEFGWHDIHRTAYTEDEIGDICSHAAADLPFSSFTKSYPRRFSEPIAEGRDPAVATYWSNLAGTCVPESRPNLTVQSPQSDATTPYKTPLELRGDTNDRHPAPLCGFGLAKDPIDWYVDGHFLGTQDLVGGPNVDPCNPTYGQMTTPSNLAPGKHTAEARITGENGATAESGPISFTVTLSPPYKPSIISPADNATFGTDQALTYRATSYDPQDGSIVDGLKWGLDSPTNVIGTGAQIVYTISTVGNHTIYATATNSAGATTNASIVVHVTAPAGGPTVQITAPISGASYGTGQTVTFTATATDPTDGSLSGSQVKWTDDIDGTLGTTTQMSVVLSGGPCHVQTHQVTVTATDNAGRTGSDTIFVTEGNIC